MATCYVPFNNKNLDISFFVFRPTVVYVDELLEALKQFSFYTESLGCVHNSILRSIHGNMIIWYGAWMKRNDKNKQLLTAALLSVLKNVASMAILLDHSFFESYAGESGNSLPTAKFATGDIISLSTGTFSANKSSDQNGVSYAFLAINKDRFNKMDGASSWVCFKSQTMPKIVSLIVWKSLQLCYTYILKSDYRNTVLPYLEGVARDVKYDVFMVVYVGGESVASLRLYPQHNRMLENDMDTNEAF